MRGPDEARPLALNVSDLHLSHLPPVARSGEQDWYAAMKRPIDQVKRIANSYSPPLPIVCNGDIFHKPNQPPELVNFALKHLPFMYSVAGQHDLPFHRYKDIHKSAYWTLVEANKLCHLVHRKAEPIDGLVLHGFSWGQEIHPPLIPMPIGAYNVAVIHGYVWKKGHSYPGAPEDAHLFKWRKRLRGYRVALFGDNHSGWLAEHEQTTVLNCGLFTRRRSDEAHLRPKVGLLWPDGTVTRQALDTSGDVVLTLIEVLNDASKNAIDLSGFLDELTQLGDDALDFVNAVLTFMERQKVDAETRAKMINAMEKP